MASIKGQEHGLKVVDLKTMVVENEPPYRGGRYLLFLELATDEGITGLGERITGNTYSRNLGDLKSQIGLIEELGHQFVVGEDPLRIEKIWDSHKSCDATQPIPIRST